MVETRQSVKLGIFVVVVTVLLLLSIALVGGLRWWQDTETYWVVTDGSVEGVQEESPVTFHGVEVGEVEALEIDRNDYETVRVKIGLDPSMVVPAGAQVYFRRSGLTGQKGIDISGGSLREGQILPGSAIPRGQTTLEGIESKADEVMADIVVLTQRTGEVMKHVDEVVSAVEPRTVEAIVARTDRIGRSLESASEELEVTIAEGRRGVGRVVEDVGEIKDRTRVVLDNADVAAADLSTLLRHAEIVLRVNEDDLRATMVNARRTSREAEALARELRMQPSLLLLSEAPRERELP
jgi:phospholipid/cholesterol/gamma-HCH transport system substrate-binding protein